MSLFSNLNFEISKSQQVTYEDCHCHGTFRKRIQTVEGECFKVFTPRVLRILIKFLTQ